LTNSAESLVKIRDEQFIKQLLSERLADEYGKDNLKYCAHKILKTHLRKTIIQYTIKLDSLTKTYIGIHRESDKRFEHVFSLLHLLRSSGFNEGSDLRVPRPILYLPSLSLLLMEEAEGRLLGTLLAERDANLQVHIEGAANWLAKLHDSKVTTTRIRSFDYEVAMTMKFKKSLLNLFPTFSKRIETISEKIINTQMREKATLKRKNNLCDNYVCLIHGDYHPKNIFAAADSTDSTTTVIDFEESRMGDPAFDLGYFIAQMKMSHGFGRSILDAADIFLHKYIQKSCCSDDDIRRRQMIYESQTYLQRIYHTYWLLKLEPDINLVSRWLTESEACLERADERASIS
jgi:aminoglycoside phosphotransferase (APT) family kinase protein